MDCWRSSRAAAISGRATSADRYVRQPIAANAYPDPSSRSRIGGDGFRGTPYHRIDARLQESFKITERYHAIVAFEVFNLFNHSNYGNFATTATTGTGSNAYGNPIASSGAPFEYQARSLQFIGRFSF